MFSFPKVFHIPAKTDYVVVSDLFAQDHSGGAELTLDAILQKAPGSVFRLHSMSATPELVEKNKSKVWIIANFGQVDWAVLQQLVKSGVRFFVIECDYKYCKYRSKHLHFLQEGVECDCEKQKHGRFVRALYNKAEKVFFMSYSQMNEYKRLFPSYDTENFRVQISTFHDETLEQIRSLREKRLVEGYNEKYVILSGGTWIKAEKETTQWAQKNKMPYELLGSLPHEQFLEKMAQYKGLIFRPAGYDTCPRIVLEAKLLGLECVLNDNVQHKDEEWFQMEPQDLENFLRERPNHFWNEVGY